MLLRCGLAIALLATPALALPGTATAAGFLAGAGEQSTTPPLAGSADGNQANSEFGPSRTGCPSTGFPTDGRFALQEPFSDVNGNGQWDPNVDLTGNPPSGAPEPYCDANANGRWDGIYADNGKGPATGVHDGLDVRAIAISDGRHRPVVYASVDQIGIFDYYTEQARADLANTYKVNADLVVSADHNESSPDSIGLYGSLQTPLGVGVRSGIDEYYMRFLDDRIAHAAADAVHNLRPANLYAAQTEGAIPVGASGSSYPLLQGMSQRISDQFPTSVALPHDNRVAAVDPKLGVLQARGTDGRPIFTVMSLAAHNQEMGNSGAGMSADWPGAFEHTFDATHPGIAMFLVAENGSEEDPQTSPPVIPNGSENHSDQATQYRQAQATGAQFAALVSTAARGAERLTPGAVQLVRKQICVPLENNGFAALAAGGEFGLRQGYVCDQQGNPVSPVPNGGPVPTASTNFRTFVSYADIGPDLQLLDNPGEAFPALMLGSPFGADEESCDRPNPAVPTWHARALYRFQVGLADDLIGYLIPAWGFASGTPGLFNNDSCYQDMNGHRHKLESESVGPTGANDVANTLAGLLDVQRDPSAHIVEGRFVLPDGSYSRWPTGAVGMLVAPTGQSSLDPNGGMLIGSPSTGGFGARAVDATGMFMDYDGQPQAAADLTTRGMLVLDSRGCVAARYYLNVFPTLSGAPLGKRAPEPTIVPPRSCSQPSQHGVAELQPLAAARAGLPLSRHQLALARAASVVSRRVATSGCSRTIRTPVSSLTRRSSIASHSRLTIGGRATAFGCGRGRGRVARVVVSISVRIARSGPHACRFVTPEGALTDPRACTAQLLLLAAGRGRWTLRLMTIHLPRGKYSVRVRAIDTYGLLERKDGSGAGSLQVKG